MLDWPLTAQIGVRVTALEDHLWRLTASGLDGPAESLLERYGLIERLAPDPAVVADSPRLTRADGSAVEPTAEGGFRLRVGGETLVETLPTTRLATSPTRAQNHGYQIDLKLAADERIIGLGDHQRETFALNGRRGALWIRYPVQHVPVPLLLSSRGYGLFLNTTRRVQYDIGASDPGRLRVAVAKDYADLFLIVGEPFDELIERYCRLTGRPALPPLKSFGLWLILHTRADGHDVLQVGRTLRQADIPCDNLSLEPDWMQTRYDYSVDKEWSAEKFRGTPGGAFRGGPKHLIGALARMGYSLGLWLCSRWDFTWEEERRCGEAAPAADEAVCLEGLEVSHEDENVAHAPVYMDTNTRRDEPWFKHLEKFVDDGVRFFKVDPAVLINEFPDRLYGNGRRDDEMHNIAFLLCSKQMWSDYQAYTGRRSFGISVAGWAGLQRFPGTWAGDTGGGRQSLVGILQDAIVGHSFATCDMNTAEVAGIHMGFLLPWALINSWSYYHYPGYQGDFYDGVFRDYSQLRMRLLPYLYSLARRAHESGRAMARPLCLEWPETPAAYDQTRQFLLGDSLLVTVYQDHLVLPAGRWFDLWRDELLSGDWSARQQTPPENRGGHLLLRAGGLVPTCQPAPHVEAADLTALTWWVMPGESGEFSLYLDEGDGLGYTASEYATVSLRLAQLDGGSAELTWGEVGGGQPERAATLSHCFELFGVTPPRTATSAGQTVPVEVDAVTGRAIVGPVATGQPVRLDW